MRRTLARIMITAAAIAALAAGSAVQALGLGEIDVSSNLNQRFSASIPLTEISAEDLETVMVSLASNEAFDLAGIDRAEYLSSLNFEIKNDRGRARVVIASDQIAREPVLNLLVQVRWRGGKILRDYTVLLDPAEVGPVYSTSTPSPAPVAANREFAPAPVIAVAPAPARVVPAAKPSTPSMAVGAEFYETPTESKSPKKAAAPLPTAKPAPAAPVLASAAGSYGPVAAKETLWSIAAKLRPSALITMNQMLLALAEANPVAVHRGTNVNKGAILRVPSAERIQATSASAATAKLAALRGEGKRTNAKPASVAPKAPTRQTTVAPDPSATSASAAPRPAAAASATAASAPVIAAIPAPAATPEPAKQQAPAQPPPTTPPVPVAPTDIPATVSSAVPSAAVTTAPAAAVTPVAESTATAESAATPAVATTKSPLAQPLAEEAQPAWLDALGLPLVFGILVLLLAAAAFVWSRRRKTGAKGDSAGQYKPNAMTILQAPLGGSGALGKFGESTRQSASQKPQNPASSGMNIKAVDSTPLLPAAPTPLHESTVILDPQMAAALNAASQQTVVASGKQAFDKTMQVQVDTLHIDLNDNDPVSEADFHLAYGLYDEAIVLLVAAIRQHPQRTDLQVKLAETYFAAGRPMQFQELAEGLKEKLSPAEWSKIAIMGTQICPEIALFHADAGAAGLDADFDLAFDEPTPAAPSVPATGSIEFALSPLAAPAAVPAALDDAASIDFMLGSSLTPLGAGAKTSEADALAFSLGSPPLTPGMSELELSPQALADLTASLTDSSQRSTLTPDSPTLGFSLQDLEGSTTPRLTSGETAINEINTKLDLARAYVEMGDNDMARSLLLEVQALGDEAHKQEAASLLQRLPH